MVCWSARCICGVWSVDVGADGLLEYIKSIQLVHSDSYLGESVSEGVRAGIGSVMREDGSEDALKEGMARVESMEDSDGGDGHRSSGIEIDELMFALLGFFVVASYSVVHGFFSLFED